MIEVTIAWCAFEESMITHPHPTRVGNTSFIFELHFENESDAPADLDLCERLFKETNLYSGDIWVLIADEIPKNRSHTAMSVGDEVTLKRDDEDAVTYRCADAGFTVKGVLETV
jgi:hypothetical protein